MAVTQTKLVKTSEDGRRTMYGATNDFGSIIRVVTGIEKRPLGKHAYRKREQQFVFLSGGGVILTCDVSEQGEQTSEVIKINVEADSVLVAPAFTALTFYLLPYTQFLYSSATPFSEEARQQELITCDWLTDESVAALIWG